jgi:hypothetical protein
MSDKKLRLSALIDVGYGLQPVKNWPRFGGGELNRSKHVSASEIGGCAREIKFGKMYNRPAFFNWGFAERGNIIEEWAVSLIRAAVRAEGEYRLLFAGSQQRSFVSGNQSGTPDGLLVPIEEGGELGTDAIGVEFKSVSPYTNFDNLPRDKAVKQTQQNMDLMTRTSEFNVSSSLIIHIDANNLQRRKEVVLHADADEQRRLRERADWIMTTPVHELPAEGTQVNKGCDYCEFSNECNALIRDTKQMQKAERVNNVLFGKS